MIDKFIEILTPAIQVLAKTLLSFELLIIILAGMALTWAIKVTIKYAAKKPKNWITVFILSPLSALCPSLLIWPGNWQADIAVGLAAAIISSLAWWAMVSKVGRKYMPNLVNQIDTPWANTIIDRRKHNKGKIIKERRQGG